MSKSAAKIIAGVAKALCAVTPVRKPANTRAELIDALEYIRVARCGDIALKISCRSKWMVYQAREFATNEPDTRAWIDSLQPGSVFYDIGANIGMFSMYAAMKGLKVLAFEPHYANYAALCRNLALNGMHDRVTAYCLGIADATRLDVLNSSTSLPGTAFHGVGRAASQFGTYTPEFQQGVLAVCLDDFVARFAAPPPDAIKLDVDGIEPQILAGARETLTRIRSINVEVEGENAKDRAIIDPILAAGLVETRFVPAGVQVRNRAFVRPGV